MNACTVQTQSDVQYDKKENRKSVIKIEDHKRQPKPNLRLKFEQTLTLIALSGTRMFTASICSTNGKAVGCTSAINMRARKLMLIS